MKGRPIMTLRLDEIGIRHSLDVLSSVDSDIATFRARAGDPPPRRRPADFETLMRIIIGQQLSTKAAATIAGRVEAAVAPGYTPDSFLALSDEVLRTAGLSRQKIKYARALAEAVASGRLDVEGLRARPDDDVLGQLTALPGFGRWSAEMYMIFSLERPDVWPVGDLAVQEGTRQLKSLPARPNAKEMEVLAEPWRPHRSVAALFMWHIYANPPFRDDENKTQDTA